jgi:hypothetical protein
MFLRNEAVAHARSPVIIAAPATLVPPVGSPGDPEIKSKEKARPLQEPSASGRPISNRLPPVIAYVAYSAKSSSESRQPPAPTWVFPLLKAGESGAQSRCPIPPGGRSSPAGRPLPNRRGLQPGAAGEAWVEPRRAEGTGPTLGLASSRRRMEPSSSRHRLWSTGDGFSSTLTSHRWACRRAPIMLQSPLSFRSSCLKNNAGTDSLMALRPPPRRRLQQQRLRQGV